MLTKNKMTICFGHMSLWRRARLAWKLAWCVLRGRYITVDAPSEVETYCVGEFEDVRRGDVAGEAN